MKQSESVKEIMSAMVNAIPEINNLYPSSKGYGYNYIPLEKVIDELKEKLPKFGLGYIQLPSISERDGCISLTTRIIHTSGEWIEDTCIYPLTDMKGVNKSQAAGAAITYARRYGLCAAFGITGDVDIDCNDKGFHRNDDTSSKDSPDYEQKLGEAIRKLESYKMSGLLDDKTIKLADEVIDAKDFKRITNAIKYAESLMPSA